MTCALIWPGAGSDGYFSTSDTTPWSCAWIGVTGSTSACGAAGVLVPSISLAGARSEGSGCRVRARSSRIAPRRPPSHLAPCLNALTLARWVCSLPTPPATYDSTEGDRACSALASSSWPMPREPGQNPAQPGPVDLQLVPESALRAGHRASSRSATILHLRGDPCGYWGGGLWRVDDDQGPRR